MAGSTINNSFSFSVKLAIVALVYISCNSNGVNGIPISKLQITDCIVSSKLFFPKYYCIAHGHHSYSPSVHIQYPSIYSSIRPSHYFCINTLCCCHALSRYNNILFFQGKPHHCTNYKALLVNVYSKTPTKVVTFRGNETELKNIIRHPISVYSLYREIRYNRSSQLRYWKTIGDKYLAVNSKGQLILQVK